MSDAIWVPVNAEMRGFVSTLIKEASGAAKQGARAAEREFSDGGKRAGQALAEGLASQAKLVEQVSTKLGTARKAEAQAAADLAVAEEKLKTLRRNGSAESKIIAAENAVESARQKQANAAARISREEQNLDDVRAGAAPRSLALSRAEDNLAAARSSQIAALGKSRAAEQQLVEAKDRAAAANDKVVSAERALADARDRYDADSKQAAAAERDLARAKREAEKASIDVAKADGRTKTAAAELATATDQLKAKTKTLEAVQTDLSASSKDVAKHADESAAAFDGAGRSLGEYAKLAGTAAGALAGISSAGAIGQLGVEWDSSLTQLNNQLGLTGSAATVMGDQVEEAMRTGVAGSLEDATGVIGALNAQFDWLGSEGEQTAAQLSDNFLAFSKTFGVSIEEATQTAGQLIQNGLATDVEQAADLMTAAMQRVPAQMRGELPEIINEYGTNFRALGFSGEEAFSILVSAADKGKWALDKTGDALKEFTIRGSDMSATSVAAYDAIGLSAEEMSSKIAAGGPGARDALQQVAQGILGIEDPAQRANTAIALFGTPLEDLSVDQIPQFLESLSQGAGEMEGFAGSSQQMSDNIANSLQGRLDSLKGTASSLAGEGFMKLWDAGKQFSDWASQNSAWLTPLVAGLGSFAGVIGLVVGAMALWSAVTTAWTTIQGIATGAQLLFNSALLANPITWVVAAVVGLGVALWAFFTKTETGRQMWQAMVDGMKNGWDWFTNALSVGWNWIVDNVWNPFVGWITSIDDRWNSFVGSLKNAWESFKAKAGEVVDAAKNRISEMVQSVQDIPGKVQNIFGQAGDWLKDAGRRIISGLWDGMQQRFEDAKNWLSSLPSKIRNSVGSVSFDVGGFLARNAQGSVSAYASGGIAQLEAYANGGGKLPREATIERPHGARGLVQWAESSTGGELFAPVNQLRSRTPRALAIMATGASLAGAMLVDKVTGRPLGEDYHGDLGPQVAGVFADGGVTAEDLRAFVEGQGASRPLEGALYDWGGSNWGDCSGTVSSVAAKAVGLDPFPRKFATGSEGAWLSSHGFRHGRGSEGDLRIGFKDGGPAGGHTAGTLPDGTNFEMGGGRGNGQLGGAAAGAWDSYFNEFYYLPMQPKVWNDPQVTGLTGPGAIESGFTANPAYATTSATTSTTQTAADPNLYDPTRQAAMSQQDAAAYGLTVAQHVFGQEIGGKSALDLGVDALFDFFGAGNSLTKKLLTTDVDQLVKTPDWYGKRDPGADQARTQTAEASAVAINDAAVTSMTSQQLAADPQLSQMPVAEVVQQPQVPDWGPEFFAHEIARKAKDMGLDALAATIGIATALVESGDPMQMWANHAVPESLGYRHDAVGSDADSVGLFQQRDNGAWGTVAQRMDPYESAGLFFNVLNGFDYHSMDPGAAAQKVQVSAYPDRYSQKIGRAEELLSATNSFDRGGISRGIGFMPKATIKPEEVLSPEMTPLFRKFLGFLPETVGVLQAAIGEAGLAWQGQDGGYAATAKLVGDELAMGLLERVQSAGAIWDEVSTAYQGGDAGYGELSAVIGDETAANRLVNTVADLGRVQADAVNSLAKLELPRQRDGAEAVTVVVNVDGDELLRQRVAQAEKQVEVNTAELKANRLERRAVDAGIALLA